MHLAVGNVADIEAKLAGANADWTGGTGSDGRSLAVWPSQETSFAVVCTEAKPF